MKRALLAMLLLLAAPARAEDLVSGISQDIIQITSNYTGTNIVVFGAIEQAQNAQGRNIVVVVRGPIVARIVAAQAQRVPLGAEREPVCR